MTSVGYTQGDNARRLAELEIAIKEGHADALDQLLDLGERLIQIPRRGDPTTRDPQTVRLFAKLIGEQGPIYQQYSCVKTKGYSYLTLGDLLLHTGKLAEASGDHETALKIYAQGLTLRNGAQFGHADKFKKASLKLSDFLSLIAAGRHIEAVNRMTPDQGQKFYVNHPARLNALLTEYDNEGRYKDAFDTLCKINTPAPLLIKKALSYIQRGITAGAEFLTRALNELTPEQQQEFVQKLEQEGDFIGACCLSQHLSREASNEIRIEYALKAYDRNEFSQAYRLLYSALAHGLGANNLEPLYPLLEELLSSAENIGSNKEGLDLVDYLFSHPEFNIISLFSVIKSSKCLLKYLQPFHGRIIAQLQKHPQLIAEYYDCIVSQRTLSEEDFAWFIPYVESLSSRSTTKDTARVMLRKAIDALPTTTIPSAIWHRLIKTLSKISSYEAQAYTQVVIRRLLSAIDALEKTTPLSDEYYQLLDCLAKVDHKEAMTCYAGVVRERHRLKQPICTSEKDLPWFTRYHQTLRTAKEAVPLLQHEIHYSYTNGSSDNMILQLCNLLLIIAPKDARALFCRAIAKHRLALATSSDTLHGDDHSMRRLSTKKLSSIIEDLKNACEYSNDDPMYLFTLKHFLSVREDAIRSAHHSWIARPWVLLEGVRNYSLTKRIPNVLANVVAPLAGRTSEKIPNTRLSRFIRFLFGSIHGRELAIARAQATHDAYADSQALISYAHRHGRKHPTIAENIHDSSSPASEKHLKQFIAKMRKEENKTAAEEQIRLEITQPHYSDSERDQLYRLLFEINPKAPIPLMPLDDPLAEE